MVINRYINNSFLGGHSDEQDLLEELNIEAIQMFGQDMIYLPRKAIRFDKFLGEITDEMYSEGYRIEMYPANIDGFEGSDFFSRFGLEINDNATFLLSALRWRQEVHYKNDSYKRPYEKDLIYFPMTKSLFSIDHVEHEKPFYQLNRLTMFELKCSLMEVGSSLFRTSDPDIDSISEQNDRSDAVAENSEHIEGVSNSVLEADPEDPFGNF